METPLRFVHWRDGEFYLGYLLDYPDYWTQGMSFEVLQEQLASLFDDLTRDDL